MYNDKNKISLSSLAAFSSFCLYEKTLHKFSLKHSTKSFSLHKNLFSNIYSLIEQSKIKYSEQQ